MSMITSDAFDIYLRYKAKDAGYKRFGRIAAIFGGPVPTKAQFEEILNNLTTANAYVTHVSSSLSSALYSQFIARGSTKIVSNISNLNEPFHLTFNRGATTFYRDSSLNGFMFSAAEAGVMTHMVIALGERPSVGCSEIIMLTVGKPGSSADVIVEETAVAVGDDILIAPFTVKGP